MNAMQQELAHTVLKPIDEGILSSYENSMDVQEVYEDQNSGTANSKPQSEELSITLDVQQKKAFRAVQNPRFVSIVASPCHWVNVIQTWEGRITAVDAVQDEFTAIISDRTNLTNPDEEVVIGMESVNRGDLALIEPGAVFYWNIGEFQINEKGTIRNTSDIRLRRLPCLSEAQVMKANEIGKRIAEKLHAN